MKRLILLFYALLQIMLGYCGVIPVTNLNNSGAGSLRSAIQLSQSGDTIRFSSQLLGSGNDTLVLDSQIVIQHPLKLKGVLNATDSIWISGNGLSRAFLVDLTNPTGTTIVFDSLNICNGNTQIYAPAEKNGAAIKIDFGDEIEIKNSTFKNNNAAALGGAIYGDSLRLISIQNSNFQFNNGLSGGAMLTRGGVKVKVSQTSFTKNSTTSITGGGGAISADSKLEITNCNFIENTAGINGGGVFINNTHKYNPSLLITNSQFIANSTVGDGGALNIKCSINADSLVLNLKNCLFQQNQAGNNGGALFNTLISSNSKSQKYVGLAIDNSTFKNNYSNNGGAIYAYSDSLKNTSLDLFLTNSVIDSNSTNSFSTGAIDLKLSQASILSKNINEIRIDLEKSIIKNNYSTSSSNPSAGLIAWGSMAVVSIYKTEISWNDLGSYIIGNHRLAINIDSSKVKFNRGLGVELNSKKLRKTVISASEISENQNSGLTFLGAFFGSPNVVDSCWINSSYFSGNSGAEGAVMQFLKPKNANLTINNSTFLGNMANNNGGAILIDGPEKLNLTISQNTRFINNTAAGNGGAIFIDADSINFNLKSVSLDSNNATNGGALYFRSTFDTSYVNIDSSSISYNTATTDGGAIYSYTNFNKFMLNNIECNYNSAVHGGAIKFFENQSTPGGSVEINHSYFKGNYSTNGGGLAYLGVKQKGYVKNSTLDSNITLGNGGVFFGKWLSIENSTIVNSQAGSGGVFYSPTGFFRASNTTIAENKAILAVGGVAQADSIFLKNCWVHHNEGIDYGGAFFFNKGEVNGSTFNHNLCFGRGGALSLTSNSNLSINTSTFYQNEATTYGGAICIRDFGSSPPFFSPTARCNVKNSTFLDNISPSQGSNFHFFSGSGSGTFSVNFEGNIFASNQSNHILANPVNISSSGYNIFSGMVTGTLTTDIINISPSQINFDSLNFNGGYAPTLLPGEFSVAINRGNSNDTSKAQNTYPYLVRDIGAAETFYCSKTSKASITGCDSLFLPNFKNFISSSGTYYDTTSTFLGCDSAITYMVNIFNSGFQEDSVTSCFSNYFWNFNSTLYNIKGVYYDTLVGFNGCKVYGKLKLDFVSIDSSVSVIKFGSDSIHFSANELAGNSYQWFECTNGKSILTSETNRTFTTNTNGNYLVEIEKSGCIETSNCINVSGLSSKEVNSFGIEIYPNPTQNNLNIIGLSSAQNQTILIFDVLGKEVKRYRVLSNQVNLSMEDFGSGIYLLRILNEQEIIYNQRLIKE